MKSVLLILPYFGKWPIWFEAHLKSIEGNPTINWLIPTDCEIPEEYPDNVKFVSYSFEEINDKFNQRLGFDVALNYRKFCDLKPTYGHVFEDELNDYDFWGFCDMDIIWGNIRKYMTDDVLENYDIISSRKKAISGHFNLFKNTSENKFIYKQVVSHQELLSTADLTRFDENLLTDTIDNNGYKVLWDSILCNFEKRGDSHQEYHINKWLWENGAVYDVQQKGIRKEVMYLHFINWKRTLKGSEDIDSDGNAFYISYHQIHKTPIVELKVLVNKINNIFFGFWVKEKRRLKKKKIKKLNKRVIRKFLKIYKR